jgi:hypothetical protein
MDRGQIEPALIGLDVGYIGEPDPVRRSGGEVAVEQVRGDREVVPAVGRPHPPGPSGHPPRRDGGRQAVDSFASLSACAMNAGLSARGNACVVDRLSRHRNLGHGSRRKGCDAHLFACRPWNTGRFLPPKAP